MYDTIVVPTDGSEHAVRAAEHAGALADLFDATVHAVHVVDVRDAAGVFSAGGVDEAFVEGLEEEGREAIAAVEEALGDVPIRSAVIRGRPAAGIAEYVDDHDADLLAMGTHGRRGLDRYVAGSVAERVVRSADVPALTVRATERSRVEGYDEVLLPTDGSDLAEAAVDHALAFAERAGARVHVVNVVDIGSLGVSSGYTYPREVIDRLRAEGEHATETIAERTREAGVDVVTEVREGYSSKDLLKYAGTNDVDLITMATAGRTGLERYLIGSTTARTIRRAEVPVVAINAREH